MATYSGLTKIKFGDNIYEFNPIAKNDKLGMIKPAYSYTGAATLTTAATTGTTAPTIAAKSTTSGRYYAIEIDKDGRLFVNVPWTNVNSSYLTSHRTYTTVTGKPTENQTPSFGGLVTISQISQDTTGQISATDRTITIPSTIATNSAVGLIKPWKSHTAASTGPTAATVASAVTVNAITAVSGKYYAVEIDNVGRLFVNVPWTNRTYTAVTGKPTANQTPGFGSTFTISQISQDTTGQITATDCTITIPSTVATSSAPGLIKIGYAASGKNYAVQLADAKAYVSVPWTDTKVTQEYINDSQSYPILLSGIAGVTSTVSRGETTAKLNNSLYYTPLTQILDVGKTIRINSHWSWDTSTSGHMSLLYN